MPTQRIKVKCHNLNCPRYFFLSPRDWEHSFRNGNKYPLFCKRCSENRSRIVLPPSPPVDAGRAPALT